MELVKNVFFNTDKLIENTKVKISYTGKFFEQNSQKVFVHYGFDTDWHNLTEVEMTKTELGFQSEIELPSSNSLKLCFRNENNEWDNNNNQDYSFEIEKEEVSLVSLDEYSELVPSKKLRKSYIWSKKLKLAVYKILNYLPKLISGNYKRKISED